MNNDKSTISHFIKYQAVYGFIAYLIVSWTLFGTRLTHLEENDIRQDTKIEENDLTGQEIKIRLTSIETTLELIKNEIVQ